MDSIFDRLLKATKVRDVTHCLEELTRQHEVAWAPVGGRDNNMATINLGSDPAAGLIERVTNAFDAVLERTWVERGQPNALGSPRDAVEQWFGIKDGKMVSVQDLRNVRVRDLSRRVVVSLHDSERPDRPTVGVRDSGIGIDTQQFVSSILSLNESRKLKRFFLAGAFGQGGSTALSYSPYTIIMSRAASRPGSPPHPVACTVVRFDPGNHNVDKHGRYEYAVDQTSGQPFALHAALDAFPPGTLVRHIAMDLGKYSNILTAPTGSLWYLSHHYLFNPVLPFRIEEHRENKSRGQSRTVAGNHRRLSYFEHTEYERSAVLHFREGEVTITWWVLSAEGEQARNRITNFCMASKPIIITYNGQKQGALPNTIIKNDLKLPYVERYLIVHVDCDHLDSESRRQLFPTTRESLRDNRLLDDLRRLVAETLEADPELVRLDQERKQRYIRRVDSEAAANIRRRLATRVKAAMFAGGTEQTIRIAPPTAAGDPKLSPPIPVQEPPTLLEMTSLDPKHVRAGQSFALRFRADADPSYFMDPESFIATIDPPSFGQYTGTTSVRHGHGVAYFRVNGEQEIGTTAEVGLEVRPYGSKAVSASIRVQVVDAPRDVGSGNGSAATPNIYPQWVDVGDDFWIDRGWSDLSVAEVVRSEKSIDIFVSANNRNLDRLIQRAQRRGTPVIDAIKDFYLEHVSFHALLAHFGREGKSAAEGDDNELSETTALTLDKEHERELQRASETVCGIAGQMFDLLAAGAPVAAEVGGP